MESFTRRLVGAAALGAPLLLLASTLAYLANGAGLSEGEAPGAIQVWAFIVYGVAIVGLARRLELAAPRAAAVVGVLGVIGSAGGVAYGIDAIQLAVLDGSIHDSPASPIALRIPGLFFPIALLVLGWSLARHRLAPPAAAYAVMAGAVLFPIARIGDFEAVALASDVILLVALWAIALPLLRRAAPGERAAAARAGLIG